MIDRFEHFSYALNEINKYWHKIAGEVMKKYGLKSTHSLYLTILEKYKDTGLTASQICACSCRDKSDVSRMMSILEKNGLVKKKGVNQNLYGGVFKLTQKGITAATDVKKIASNVVEIAGRNLSDQDRTTFYTALDIISNNLREMSRRGIQEE